MITFGGGGGLDLWLFEFIKGNFFTLMLVLSILKVIAKQTKWAGDGKIVTLLFEFVKNPRGKHTNPLAKEVKEDEKITS